MNSVSHGTDSSYLLLKSQIEVQNASYRSELSEKQFCYQLEHRLLFEKRTRRSIENIILEEQYGSINNNNNDKNERRDLAHTEENYSENKDDESVIMKTKNITRLHVYPRFGETLPTHSEFFYQYSSNAIPIIFEELGKRMVQEDTLLKQCLNILLKLIFKVWECLIFF